MKTLLISILLIPVFAFAQTFTPQGAGKLPADYTVNCIYPLSDLEVWALASPLNSNAPVKLCKTLDGGSTWTVSAIDDVLQGLGDDLFVQNSKVAYANLEDISNGTQWYKTQDGGLSWYKLGNYASTLIYMFNTTEGAMISVQSGLYSTDSFHTATTVLSSQTGGPPKVNGQSLLSGPNSRCINDSGLFFIYPKGYVVRTQDKGKTWKGVLVGLNNNRSTCGIAASGNAIIAVQWPLSSSVTKGMSRSYDGGNTWTNISSFIPSAITSPQTISDVPGQKGHFVLTGFSQLYHSTDSGTTWTDLAPPVAANNASSGVFKMSSTNVGWYGMNVSATSDPIIYKCVFGFVNDVKNTVSNNLNLHCFPNPAEDNLYFDVVENGEFILYGINGNILLQGNAIAGTNVLNLAYVPAGVACLVFKSDAGKVYKNTVIIR